MNSFSDMARRSDGKKISKLQFWHLVLLLNIVSLIDVICINKETVRSEYEYEWEEKRQHVCVRDLC